MKTFLSIFFVTVALLGCDQNSNTKETADKTKFEPVSINNDYKMDIPEFMSKATSLNEGASLQFQNIFKETYVIVIDEEKDAFVQSYKDIGAYDTTRSVISNYADTQIQSTEERLQLLSKTELKRFKINGLNASSVELDATIEGVKSPITYFMSFVEGRDKLYFIMAWTLQERKDKYRGTFETMVQSFRVFKR